MHVREGVVAVIAPSLEREILNELNRLDEPELRRVLEFVRSLPAETVKGESGDSILRIVGTIPPEDLKEMRDAIEADCERIDSDGW